MTRIAYLGPAGTFSNEAALGSLALAGTDPGGAELIPLPTIHGVVMAVQSGEADRGLVPIENSLEGPVSEAVDALVHDAPNVRIVGETVLAIHYVLAGRDGLTIDAVSDIHSHPQALGQCARSLRDLLPEARVHAATSTAEAMRHVAQLDEPAAALGPRLAAGLYGLSVLREGIEDRDGNVTRFVWLAPAGETPAGEDTSAWKSSITFVGDGDGDPGWLVRCLSEFAFRGVNLTRIESRPAKRRLGHYVFLLDFDGRADVAGPAADAIGALSALCENVQLLGTYPAAT